ncbi:transcriptional regulator [Pokkaliibacter plantistimulans]|uniref:Transcriptional regulator n=1 Tax=Pokkaliibacter plantistimulans TaxID=1635171 RepID=A0ABX5LSG6_9GAMM|nr:sigma D regulator [Pokkaliibacter plantistimulans]PXF29281.1 transcriptional regulator [Pokkaliibacter plantistimulans]
MLEKCESAKERWGGVSDLIDAWLQDRQEVLVAYFNCSRRDHDKSLHARVQKLCSWLVDYASKGHFEIYELLLQEAEQFNDGGLELAATLMPKVESTTQILLDFNDDFSSEDDMTLAQEEGLPDRLSELGEVLEERFGLEDQLIELLHFIHRDHIADEVV